MTVTVLKIVAFIVSLLGYRSFWKYHLRKNAAFFPLFYIAFNVVALFPFGLIGKLNAGYNLIVITGIVLLILNIKKIRNEISIKQLFDLSLIMFVIGAVWSYIITRNAGISRPDDIAHWYRICKVVAFEDGFPCTTDIRFPSYLPGTALWIYQITKTIGFSVSNCFFAQSLIDLSCAVSLISVVSGGSSKVFRAITYFAVIVAALVFRTIDISIYTLLVDTILGLVPMTVVIYLFDRQEKIDKADITFVVIGCIFESLIKASGIMLVIGVTVFLYSMLPKKRRYVSLISLILPVFFVIGYSFLMSRRFTDYGTSAQAVSVQRYASIISSKDSSILFDIIARFIFELFNVVSGYPQIILFWACILAMAVMAYKKKEVTVARILGAMATVYILGMLFIYIFSMENTEANAGILNSFDRYLGTFVIFQFGILFFLWIRILERSSSKYKNAILLIAGILLLVFSICKFEVGNLFGHGETIYVQGFDDSTWKALDSVCDENTLYSNEKYVVLFADNIYLNDYPWKNDFLVETFFRNENSVAYPFCYINSNIYPGDEKKLENCDYIVIVGDDTDLPEYLNELYPDIQFATGINRLR